MMNTEVDVNPYQLLDVKIESTDQEIRTAYRQRSLKVHPDRVRIHLCASSVSSDILSLDPQNRDNPDAGESTITK
jgi:hypothetical protein